MSEFGNSAFTQLLMLLTSLGIGLLMGLERERNPAARAGFRTFGLVGLFGAVCALITEHTGTPWVLAAGLILVGAMMIAAYISHPDPEDPGTTSVIALMLCFTYGAMVVFGLRSQAVTLAILSTILLYMKPELHHLSRSLTRKDLVSIFQFAVLSLVILPVLPDRDLGPYGALNPSQLWWMVVLISGISLAGYAALRLLGQGIGAPLLGMLGGLVSSTATTLVFSRHARAQPATLPLSVLVIVLANLVVLVRLGAIAAMLQPAVLPGLLPMLGGGLLAGIAFVLVAWRRWGQHNGLPEMELNNPTEIRVALTFGAVYALVLVFSAGLADVSGNKGVYAVALISGLTDVDAITLSSLRMFGLEKLGASAVVTAIFCAELSNLLFKLGVVASIG
ncbi:MAG TPA: MgtC/SapB family protein, partial [Rhodocyclaceae bacterium]|nr:MgtC/SapB family protein [Rhodocyclaceae bacterium]